MNELISIIVPVYNTRKYLGRCVESILNQTYKELQIILVDDGSAGYVQLHIICFMCSKFLCGVFAPNLYSITRKT